MACVLMLFLVHGAVMAFDEEMELQRHYRDEGFVLKTVVSELEEEVVINIQVPDLTTSIHEIDGETYCSLNLDEAGSTMTPGEPMVPMIGKIYQISDTRVPVVSVEVIRSHTELLPYPLIPAQEDQEICDIVSVDAFDPAVYSDSDWYPLNRVFVDRPVIIRDIRVLPVAYYPVRYHGPSQTIEVIDEAALIIRMVDGATVNILDSHGPFSPSWDTYYKALVPNYESDAESRSRGVAERYLFIMRDEFESRCQGFFAWKEQQGFAVDILRFSEMGGNPSAATVKSYVQAIYDGPNRPVYASIIGSTNNFPVYESYDTYMGGNYDNDFFYSQLDGDDLFADIFLSRYPAVNGDELSTMLAKILYYERHPNSDDREYYSRALMACSGLYASQQLTKEQTRDRLLTDLNYSTVNEMYDWSVGGVSQVLEWMNEGVSIINYRGEGWQSGWNPAHAYGFHTGEVYSLHNGDMMPVITSIGCGVAMFDGYSDCFGHSWMVHGSPGNMQGAVAFMGPTYNTRTTVNNWLDRGMYRGFCYHDITRSSAVYNYGKTYMHNHFLGTPYMTNDVPTHIKEYVLFGNPDLWWRTSPPITAEVYNAWCPNSRGEGIVVIDTEGRKLPNAQVCFLKDNEQRVYVTDSGGGCQVYMGDITEPAPCTVTGWNLLPCDGTFSLPEAGDDGDIIITEVKPDIEMSGTAGDRVEIANLEIALAVNLKGWTIGDLDGYDRPFVNQDAVLGPRKVAVIEIVGYHGEETVTETAYGLYITSRSMVGLSSLEDSCMVRNTDGRIRDGIYWHNGSGIGSTNESLDMSKLTQPTTTLAMGFRGWWTGPDEVTQEMYETYAIDWSMYAGNGGPGSIQRIGLPGVGVYDSPSYFMVSINENFGSYSFPDPTLTLTKNLKQR